MFTMCDGLGRTVKICPAQGLKLTK